MKMDHVLVFVVLATIHVPLLCHGSANLRRTRLVPKIGLRHKKETMTLNDNDEEGFKKERGVRGQCFYTYLELETKSTTKAVTTVHGLEGWDDLSQADARYTALEASFSKYADKVKTEIDPLEESIALTRIEPTTKEINAIKEYQRDMTKTMLDLVKLAEKNQFVTYFYELDAVGRFELPCIKAIQESYAARYPTLLNELTSEVRVEVRDKLDDTKRKLEGMVAEYIKKIDKLEAAITKIPEIKSDLVKTGWKFPEGKKGANM